MPLRRRSPSPCRACNAKPARWRCPDPRIPHGGTAVDADHDYSFSFGAADQEDNDIDSGLVVDEVDCISRFIFNSNFENGSFVE